MGNQRFENFPIGKEKLDDKWYERFKEAGSFQAYEYLDGDKAFRESQKMDFLEGKIENPVLDYPKLDSEILKQKENELRQLRREIKSQEINPTVSQLYRWRINEKIAELEMLQASLKGDMRNFRRYSEFVYGKPSKEIFLYTVESIRTEVKKHLGSENPELRKYAEEMDKILPQTEKDFKISSLPEKEIVENAREKTLKELGELVEISEQGTGKEFVAEEIKSTFEEALSKLKSQGWEVVIDKSSKTGISVDQEKMQVKVPESRTLLAKKLKTLVAHEIGTHVARRINGERSKLMLLGLGLDRYEKGEEGVATMREQAIGGKVVDFAGLTGHLPISLAMGLDGQKRDFRRVYETVEKYLIFKSLVSGKSLEESKEKASKEAWNRCIRTFRGTDCKTPGVCFTKDIIYREGNIGVWDVLGKNSDEMMRFNVGKYDPSNPRHIWILSQLGITDQDLERIEEKTQ